MTKAEKRIGEYFKKAIKFLRKEYQGDYAELPLEVFIEVAKMIQLEELQKEGFNANTRGVNNDQ